MVESSEVAVKKFQAIFINSNDHFYDENNENLASTVIKLFGFPMDSIVQTAAAA